MSMQQTNHPCSYLNIKNKRREKYKYLNIKNKNKTFNLKICEYNVEFFIASYNSFGDVDVYECLCRSDLFI